MPLNLPTAEPDGGAAGVRAVLLLGSLTLTAAALPVGVLAGQEVGAGAQAAGSGAGGPAWFPERSSFAPLLAAPREVALRGAFLVADREERPDDFRGTNLEADVALGHRLPVVRLRRAGEAGPEVTLGFEVGVVTRFFMETAQKDLINADFRVGAPLSLRRGRWRGRLTLLHASSHLGDDFVARFDPPARQVTRDGFELLVARRTGPDLRLYAGGEWNFHVNPGVERTGARAGVEWDPDPGAGAHRGPGPGPPGDGPGREDGAADAGDRGGMEAWPFAAADARITSLTGEVAGSAAGGLALRVEGVVLRLEARAHVGPTPLGHLRTRDETSAGLGLRVEP